MASASRGPIVVADKSQDGFNGDNWGGDSKDVEYGASRTADPTGMVGK
jgi:hypothetical protein